MGKNVYNKFQDDEIWEDINKESKQLLKDYILDCKARSLSPKTVYQSERNVKVILFIVYEMFENISILKLKAKQWKQIVLFLKEERELSHARINAVMSANKMLLNTAIDDEDYDLDISPMHRVKGLPKKEVREIVFLSDEQITLIKEELTSREEWQELLLLGVLYDSGCRKSEAGRITKEFLHSSTPNKTKKVLGKRGKLFNLFIFPQTIDVGRKWLDIRGEDNIDSLWVKIKKDGTKEPLNTEVFFFWVKRWMEYLHNRTGIMLNANPHSIRHSFAEEMYSGKHYGLKYLKREKLLLDEIQLLLNHESPDMTAKYIKPKNEEKKNELFGITEE